jgi:8-oxo-dGTP pyrophosphatase MutT (NUDIX family)
MPDYLNLLRQKATRVFAITPILIAAGIAIQAKDTGRVLMIQRALSEDDPASGKWEFPGGHIDEGETPIQAAIREFQEESGLKLPQGDWTGQWVASNDIYKGFIFRIPSESDLDLNPDHEDRHVLNPDDPDGDNIEVIAWWSPSDLVQNPAIRDELKDLDWMIFRQAQAQAQAETKALIASRFNARLTEFYNRCHDEATGKFCEDPVTKKQVRIEKASPEEHKAAKAKAKAWIRIAKIPNAAEVAKGKANALKAKQGKSHRTTTEDRGGSAEARRKQRENLFTEFGGDKRGYVVDHQSGIKMHYTDDPTLNPNQYPMFTRGRIFTGIQGGGYTLDNLLPESFETNRKRGSRPIRKENLT